MKKIDKSLLPDDYTTDKNEDGFYAEFHEDGQLAHYGFYEDGELDDRWALYLEPEGNGAFVQKTVTVDFMLEEEGDSHNGHHPELTQEEEDEYVEFAKQWIARIHEDSASPPPRCSFCEKSAQEVHKLIAGPMTSICDECIEFCQEILTEGERPEGE